MLIGRRVSATFPSVGSDELAGGIPIVRRRGPDPRRRRVVSVEDIVQTPLGHSWGPEPVDSVTPARPATTPAGAKGCGCDHRG